MSIHPSIPRPSGASPVPLPTATASAPRPAPDAGARPAGGESTAHRLASVLALGLFLATAAPGSANVKDPDFEATSGNWRKHVPPNAQPPNGEDPRFFRKRDGNTVGRVGSGARPGKDGAALIQKFQCGDGDGAWCSITFDAMLRGPAGLPGAGMEVAYVQLRNALDTVRAAIPAGPGRYNFSIRKCGEVTVSFYIQSPNGKGVQSMLDIDNLVNVCGVLPNTILPKLDGIPPFIPDPGQALELDAWNLPEKQTSSIRNTANTPVNDFRAVFAGDVREVIASARRADSEASPGEPWADAESFYSQETHETFVFWSNPAAPIAPDHVVRFALELPWPGLQPIRRGWIDAETGDATESPTLQYLVTPDIQGATATLKLVVRGSTEGGAGLAFSGTLEFRWSHGAIPLANLHAGDATVRALPVLGTAAYEISPSRTPVFTIPLPLNPHGLRPRLIVNNRIASSGTGPQILETVELDPTPADRTPPAIESIVRADQNIVISVWPRFASYDLEETKSLSPMAIWRPVPPAPVSVNQRLTTVLPGNEPSRFFRLRQRVAPSILRSVVNPANRHTYHLIAGPDADAGLSWTDAEAFAVALGGHLVTINDPAENAWIAATFPQEPYLWIGLHDSASEGRFVWSSGEPVEFTHWYPGEPNDYQGGEDYVHLYNFPGGQYQWNDNKNVVQIGSHRVLGLVEVE